MSQGPEVGFALKWATLHHGTQLFTAIELDITI